MELADYLRVVRRRWWLIALAMLLCVGGAFGATQLQTPRYTASTELFVAGKNGETTADELVARQLASQRAGAYSILLGKAPAVAIAAQKAGATGSSPAVQATADGTTPSIVITVTANSGQAAAGIANAYATALPEIITALEQRTADLPPITVVSPAVVPSTPSSPNLTRNLIVGAVLGLLLGLVGALVRETLDARLRDSSEIEKLTGVTLLGSIPREHTGDVLPSLTRPRSGRAEAYRHVRTNLEFTSAEGMPRSVVVTSAAPGEGKSSLSANLAVVAARSGRSVVLVDADLRKPSVAKYFGVQSSVGLADVLMGRWRWQEALVPVEGERIHVLTSGPIPRFPSELVGSSTMSQLIMELEQHFDFVIVDTPPVLPVSDALVIGVNVGGVIVVARMVETRRAALKRAIDAVRKVNVNLLGVVGNAVVKQEEKAYGEGYGYAYGYISDAPAEPHAAPTVQPASRRDASSHRRRRHAAPAPEPLPQPLASYPTISAQEYDPQQGWYGGAPEQQQGYPAQGSWLDQQQAAAYADQGYPQQQQPAEWGYASPGAWSENPPASPVEPLRLDDVFRQPRPRD